MICAELTVELTLYRVTDGKFNFFAPQSGDFSKRGAILGNAMASVAKWLRQWIVVPPLAGSSPVVRPLNSLLNWSDTSKLVLLLFFCKSSNTRDVKTSQVPGHQSSVMIKKGAKRLP